ncbi:unnamed protein product [Oncorhynchus mykiss]|uniref:Fibronectin type-III domain-containing protein n=1 Tax=Oncorhynchus mykiss TaxID=8022 RepID=A0A060Y9T3_ONCMY|nr:unnamed protein product [Oncorhynchus mykiss]
MSVTVCACRADKGGERRGGGLGGRECRVKKILALYFTQGCHWVTSLTIVCFSLSSKGKLPPGMAAPSFLLLFPLGLLSAVRSASLMDPGSMTSSDPSVQAPHLTGCKSREQETFRCWWSPGSFQNLTEPGALQIQYWKKNDLTKEWKECPDYSSSVKNECFFNKNNTVIWIKYCVRLHSESQNKTYDTLCFELQDIVHPDPPVALNWTLLNISRSGLNYDIMASWEPPPSADVSVGWLTLVYEVQYRRRNSSHWKVLEHEFGTQQSIYGLQTGEAYEVRVHCAMRAFNNFGEFSDVIFVHVPEIPNKESTFPVTLVLIFGAVGVAILLMLIIFSQQQRLMVILLPPVPAPKIKGIDPALLKASMSSPWTSSMSTS